MFSSIGSTSSLRLAAFVAAICVMLFATQQRQTFAENLLIDFESQPPRDPTLGGNFWVGNPGFTVENTTFLGGTYQGFVISSSTITGTGGYFYSQQFAASSAAAEISAEANAGAGGGIGGGQFAVGYSPGSTINIPAGYRPESVFATNTATVAWLLSNPDPNGFASPLVNNGQEFSVLFTGWSQVGGGGTQLGSVKFVLGSYSTDTRTIVTDWTEVDLTGLGAASSISLTFASYDEGEYGINTPMYVALDNLTLAPVPEPSGIVLLACGGAIVGALAWRRRRQRAA